MLKFIFVLMLACCTYSLSAAERVVPWKLDLSLGFEWAQDSSQALGKLELGYFHQVLVMDAPDFYDLGGRITLLDGGFQYAAGVRHKLYFSPFSSLDQEVLLGQRFMHSVDPVLFLGGSFGGSLPFSGLDIPYPSLGLLAHLTWSFLWWPDSRGIVPSLGYMLGISGNLEGVLP